MKDNVIGTWTAHTKDQRHNWLPFESFVAEYGIDGDSLISRVEAHGIFGPSYRGPSHLIAEGDHSGWLYFDSEDPDNEESQVYFTFQPIEEDNAMTSIAPSIEIAGYAIVQYGFALFGVGETIDAAVEDANEWAVDFDGIVDPLDEDDLKSPDHAIRGDMILLKATRALLDGIRHEEISRETGDWGIFKFEGQFICGTNDEYAIS